MNVTINGDAREIPDTLSVAALLLHLKIQAGRVAVERNLEILPREKWESTVLVSGDRLEIVHFVGGG